MIQTVLGEIPAAAAGRVSMHDHLIADSRMLARAAATEPPDGDRVTTPNLGWLRWNLLGIDDNLVLGDAALATAELRRAGEAGISTLVDLTSWGLGPSPAELPAISRDAGVNVVAGVGVYLDRPHPAWIASRSVDELTATLLRSLEEELEEGCGFRAGIIGIIGTGEPLSDSEERVLMASAAAAGESGASMTVRLDADARRGPELIARIVAAGCPAERVILGNVDEYIDRDYHRALAATGATLEWCFGNEAHLRPGLREPSDGERIAALVRLLAEDGMAERCVLGGSVWTKTQLRAFGGCGYEHLLRNVVPSLQEGGVSDAAVEAMLVSNPARLLDR
ncbi:MAG TPA: phosphotriesterase [Solirubrobacterales bacterium]|nr:phosphotriesterase [Solirubrobacterales bacterium]